MVYTVIKLTTRLSAVLQSTGALYLSLHYGELNILHSTKHLISYYNSTFRWTALLQSTFKETFETSSVI